MKEFIIIKSVIGCVNSAYFNNCTVILLVLLLNKDLLKLIYFMKIFYFFKISIIKEMGNVAGTITLTRNYQFAL